MKKSNSKKENCVDIIMGIDPVWLAECFHDFYESYADLKGWETQESTRVAFKNLPDKNKETMICTCSSVLRELAGKIILKQHRVTTEPVGCKKCKCSCNCHPCSHTKV